MGNKHEDWIDALRETATSDGGELPERLWKRISASLDAAPSSTGAPPPHPLWRRRFHVRAASVAAVIIIAVGGVFLFRVLTEDPDIAVISQTEVAAEVETPVGNAAAGFTEPEPEPEPEPEQAALVLITGLRAGVVIDAVALSESVTPLEPELSEEPAVESGGTAEPETVPDAVVEPEKSAGKDAGKENVSSADFRTLPRRERVLTTGKSRRGMIALSVSGAPSVSDGAPDNILMRAETAMLAPNRQGMLSVRPPQYTYRHKQPLTFALSMDFNVGHNLFVGAGVGYTRLSSIATAVGSGAKFDQLLQYVGVPVTLKWAFLNTKFFMLYTGAEAQAEFCVDARFDGRKADERTMQWSVHALAGAQLNLGRHAGIYVEPKLSHYFLDTELETVRNTGGVNFNLQFGLRFSY